ncbi:MAG: HU family DNA-binding protein [Acidobacteria bacterium]|nr:HU family DNA-binding protein [Acidobacteriota bacterium]MCA1633711.1 HU family DNA-binding protein [Acidobacteriota bacterium]
MVERIQKKEIARRLAARMKTSEAISAMWLDAMLDTFYESFKSGQGVTLSGFGNFYVRPECERWVFRFNPSQKLRALFGWSSTYRGGL